ncbi:MAG TPA: phage holin family protein [Mycobacteriales bacterium]
MATETNQEPAARDDTSVGELVRDATTHLSTLIRGEIELAKLELAASVRRLGWGTGFFGAAATLLCFSLFFPFVALAEGLVALGLPRWGAYLVVWLVLLVLAVALGLVGIRMVRKIRRPERTIEAVRDTARLTRRRSRRRTDDVTDSATDSATGPTTRPADGSATEPGGRPD